ncbi:MAG: autotransporter domain-containing protein, partial [Verrucomicrobia bacterium]|nr:autotransporter domain-containing protein [Verrucomicrobiota bacterium]
MCIVDEKSRFAIPKLCIVCLLFAVSFFGTEYTWNGGSNGWAIDGSWTPTSGYPNGPNDTASFPNYEAITPMVLIGASNVSVGTILFSNTSGNDYTISSMGGGDLLLYSEIAMTQANEHPSFSCTVNLAGNVLVSTSSGTLLTFNQPITGSSGLTLSGDSSAVLLLEEACSYTGTTTIDSGTYKGAGSSSLFPASSAFVLADNSSAVLNLNGGNQTIASLSGGGSVILDGGTLTVGDSTSTTFSGTITDGGTTNGGLVKQGSGSLSLTGTSNTYTGETRLNAGTLAISGGGSLGANTIDLSGGTLSVVGNSNLTQSGFVGADTIITTASGATLDWTGTITVSLGGPYTITLEGEGTNSLSSLSTGMGGTLTIAGNIGGTAGLTTTGGGTIKLSGTNSYSGGTTVLGGTLQLISGGSLPTGGAVQVNGILDLSSGPSSQTIGNLSGTGTSLVISGVALTVNSSSSSSFSGAISGSGGSLSKQGGGTLSLSGTNTYSGGTTIAEGTLALTGGGSLESGSNVVNEGTLDLSAGFGNQTLGDLSGNGNFILGNTELTFGTSTASETLPGVFSGTGILRKQGSGTVILGGTSTGSFSTYVTGGTLSVNGQLPGTVTVDSGAILKGTGTVLGQLMVNMGGIVAPGNSIGTLTVASAIFYPSSVFQVEINSSSSSFLDVLGALNLGEGMGNPYLQVALDPGDYPHSNTYEILSAETISGSFSSPLLGVPAGFNFTLSQLGDVFTLSYYLSSIPTTGLSGNQSRIVNYLNQYGTSSSVLLLYQLTENALQKAINSISPARNAFGNYIAAQTAFSLSELLSVYLDNCRFRARPTGGSPLVADASDDIAFLMQRKKPCIKVQAPAQCPCCSVWVSGFGELAYTGASSQNPSFHFNSGGALLGFDYRGQEENLVGGSLGYAHSHFYDAGAVGKGQINYFFLAVYGNGSIGDFYLSPAVWGISSTTHNDRWISFPGFSATACADIPTWQLVPHLEMGYEIDLCALELIPFAAVDWAISWQKSYTENGAAPFNAHQKACRSSVIRAEAGLKFYERWDCDWGAFLLREKGSYVFEEPFDTGKVIAAFAGTPGSFTV